jgi:GNAT superfamily N-acetyltransferase
MLRPGAVRALRPDIGLLARLRAVSLKNEPTPTRSTIEYRAQLPASRDFVRLFRSSGWDEALDVPDERLAASIRGAWYAVTAYRGEEAVGMGLVLSDGVLHALIVDVIVLPELRGHGIGTEIMNRLIARCCEADVLQVQLFSARGKRSFYERLGFVARPEDGPGMELG